MKVNVWVQAKRLVQAPARHDRSASSSPSASYDSSADVPKSSWMCACPVNRIREIETRIVLVTIMLLHIQVDWHASDQFRCAHEPVAVVH